MASDWQPSKLGDVIAVNPSRPLVKGSHSVYISMQQVETANRSVNEIDHRTFKGSGARFQNGDTLLARITPCLENGKTAYVDFLDDEEVGHGSTEFIVLSGIEGVSDDLFVYYLARFPEFRNFAIVRMEGSSGRQRVPAPTLKKYVFACPSYDEQRAIAHILGSLDDKIELNHRMNRTLEAMARAIFKSWFVDFDPVRAKAEGRPTGLPDDIAALFPDSFEDSELGEIPKGWEVVTFEELTEAKQGKYIPKNDMSDIQTNEHIYPVWGGNGIRGYSSTYMYEEPVVVLTCRGSNCGRIDLTESPAWISNIAFACSPKYGSINFINVYFHFSSFSETITGSAQPQITYTSLKNKRMQFPVHKEICDAYSKKIDSLYMMIRENNRQSTTLATLRDTLLPKLISGELRVPDAEKFVEEAGL